MKLKTVTLITICGLSVALISNLLQYPWDILLKRPPTVNSFFETICFYGSVLFFLIYLYRKS
jgi:hypothetical protein